MDVKEYWRIFRMKESALAEYVHLVMLPNPARGIKDGVMTVANRTTAARCLVDGTHREATPEETAAYIATEESKRLAIIEKAKPILPVVQNHITIDKALIDSYKEVTEDKPKQWNFQKKKAAPVTTDPLEA